METELFMSKCTCFQLNNINVESISLQDARRQLEKSKEKLLVTLKKPPRAPSVTNLLHKRQNRYIVQSYDSNCFKVPGD